MASVLAPPSSLASSSIPNANTQLAEKPTNDAAQYKAPPILGKGKEGKKTADASLFTTYMKGVGSSGVKKTRNALGPKVDLTADHATKEVHELFGVKDDDISHVATGEDFAPSAEDPDTGEDTDMDETDETEDRRVAAMLAQGRHAQQTAERMTRPPEIEKLWRSLYPIVKGWWTKGGKDLTNIEIASIDKIQDRIETRCSIIVRNKLKEDSKKFEGLVENSMPPLRLRNENLGPDINLSESDLRDSAEHEIMAPFVEELKKEFKFPAQEMFVGIRGILATLHEVGDTQNLAGLSQEDLDLKRQQDEKSLFKGIAAFLHGLEITKVPVDSVVPSQATSMWKEISDQASPESRAMYNECFEALRKPTQEQMNAWTQNVPEIEKALNMIESLRNPTPTDKAAVSRILVLLDEQNEELEASNKALDIPPDTNLLPHGLLTNLYAAWSNKKDDEFARAMTDLKDYLAEQPLATVLYPRIKEMGKAKAVVNTDQGNNNRTAEASTSSTSTTPATKSTRDDMASDINSDTFARTNLAALRNTLDDNIIEMFDYADGMTEFGPVVGVRPCTSDNPNYSRFIVNVGTEDFPHHKAVRGSELCPGGAGTLSECSNMDTVFDLRERKRQVKTIPGFIESVGPCVETQRLASYIPRPGVRTRRPDLYLNVTYKDEKKEWLCRTEYVQLVGKSCAERHIAQLTSKYDKRSAYINECRRRFAHPGTGEKLTEQDRLKTPWLFEIDVQASTSAEDRREQHPS